MTRNMGSAVDASRGTVVFGNGVSALVGEIAHNAGDDYLIVDGYVSGAFDKPEQRFCVPLSSIVYVRYEEEIAP